METILKNIDEGNDQVNLLLVGNNPIELSAILGKIENIRGKKITTEIAFDITSLFERLMSFRPDFILIDDQIGKAALREVISSLTNNRRTKNIPVTVLKNSNYQESMGSFGVLDYLLKQNISSDSLLNTIKNSLKFRRTQLFLHKAYNLRKRQLTGA
jgi:DNA-binding NarL/FixJ family response regulator